MADAIILESVRKTFGRKVAVDSLDLVVPQGTVYGFIGPNGAGKTTSIRMIMSILYPDQGRIEILGHPSALEAKDRIGYLPEERGVYKKMKVGAFLEYMAALKGVPGSGLRRRVQRWLSRVGLPEVEQKKCEELSKGMQQKIQLVAAMLPEPELMILDEPFSGLDPVNMRLLRELILEQHQRGATVIFSTHVMQQAEQICDHIVMINDGKKVLDDTLSAIRDQFDPRSLLLEPRDPRQDSGPLERIDGIERVARLNGVWELRLREGLDPSSLMAAVAAAVPAARIELHRPTLEDIFIEVVSESSWSEEQTRSLRAALRADASSAEAQR